MFRGFRWQLTAMLLALVLFLAGAAFRLHRQTTGLRPAPPRPAVLGDELETPSAVETPRPQASRTQPSAADAGTPIDSSPAYREGMVGAVGRLNPLFAHLNPVDRDISSLIFEGLFATNEYGEVVPRLAERLVISADGIEYVVRLRQDIRWQDGTAFSADDVAYTMSLLSDPEYAKIAPLGEFFATVETQILGDHLLRFRLAQPMSSFPTSADDWHTARACAARHDIFTAGRAPVQPIPDWRRSLSTGGIATWSGGRHPRGGACPRARIP